MRFFSFFLVVILVFLISLYGHYNPPVQEIPISDWFKNANNNEIHEHNFCQLAIVNIQPDSQVLLRDRFKQTITCQAYPSLKEHPYLTKTNIISVILKKSDNVCLIIKSLDGSGYRKMKLLISIFGLILVLIIFFQTYRFQWKKLTFVKRNRG